MNGENPAAQGGGDPQPNPLLPEPDPSIDEPVKEGDTPTDRPDVSTETIQPHERR